MFLSLWPTYLLRTVLYLLSGWRGDKLWVPERSAVNRCRERFWRVEVRVLRRSYLSASSATQEHISYRAPLTCTPPTALPVHLVYSSSSESVCGPGLLAVIQDPVPRTAAGGFFIFKNLDLLPSLRMKRKILSSRQLGLVFFFLSFSLAPG